LTVRHCSELVTERGEEASLGEVLVCRGGFLCCVRALSRKRRDASDNHLSAQRILLTVRHCSELVTERGEEASLGEVLVCRGGFLCCVRALSRKRRDASDNHLSAQRILLTVRHCSELVTERGEEASLGEVLVCRGGFLCCVRALSRKRRDASDNHLSAQRTLPAQVENLCYCSVVRIADPIDCPS